MTTQSETRSNGLATTSLILGIISVLFPFFVLSVLAIVFGGVGLAQTKPYSRDHDKAVWGVVLGIFSIFISIVVTLVIWHATHQPVDPGCDTFYSC